MRIEVVVIPSFHRVDSKIGSVDSSATSADDAHRPYVVACCSVEASFLSLTFCFLACKLSELNIS